MVPPETCSQCLQEFSVLLWCHQAPIRKSIIQEINNKRIHILQLPGLKVCPLLAGKNKASRQSFILSVMLFRVKSERLLLFGNRISIQEIELGAVTISPHACFLNNAGTELKCFAESKQDCPISFTECIVDGKIGS
jgi:hypothetical protein